MGKLFVTTTLFDAQNSATEIDVQVISCSSQAKADAAIAILEESGTNWTGQQNEFVGVQIVKAVYVPSL